MLLADFSCVIVTYNREISLLTLLSDINQQSILPHEVIIVNNGNPIRIQEYVFKFKILQIQNLKNSLTIGRNLGLSKILTSFVFFLDDDIRITNINYFESMIYDFDSIDNCFGLQAFIKQDYSRTLRSAIHKLFFLYTLEDNCTVKPSINVTYPREHQTKKILNCQWLSGTNQLYKTKELKRFKWDEKLFKYCDGEDLDFTYNLFLNKKILCLTFNQEIIHSESTESRLESKELIYMREVYGFYFFSKYFQTNIAKLIYVWSRFGKLFICIYNLIRMRNMQSILNVINICKAFLFVFSNSRDIKVGNLSKFNKKFNYEI
jgi:glycosyltransferase involved in cell wall biosynthesis